MLITCPPSKFPRFYLCTRNSDTKTSSHKAVPFSSADMQKASTVADHLCGCANPGRPFCRFDGYPLLVSLISEILTPVWFPPFHTHSILCALFYYLQKNILYNGGYLAEHRMLSGSHPSFSTASHPVDPSQDCGVFQSRTSYASVLVSYSTTSSGPITVVLHSRTSYASVLVSYSITSYGSTIGLHSIT